MLPELKQEALQRLRSASGHLDSVRRMVESDTYCVDIMKQVAAVQGSLEAIQGLLLRNHLATCVSEAVRNGMGDAVIDELMGALRYDKRLLNGHGGPATLSEDPVSHPVCSCHASAAHEDVRNTPVSGEPRAIGQET